jgi:hypothetical protein
MLVVPIKNSDRITLPPGHYDTGGTGYTEAGGNLGDRHVGGFEQSTNCFDFFDRKLRRAAPPCARLPGVLLARSLLAAYIRQIVLTILCHLILEVTACTSIYRGSTNR